MPGRSALALVACVLVLTVPAPTAAKEFAVRGMVLKVDAASRTFFVSHEKVVGLMDAMTMPFEVRDVKELESLAPGAIVEFTLVVGDSSVYATGIRVRRYESAEQDPFTARRLALLKKVAGTATTPLAVGARVPDFTLIDQTGARVALSRLTGKVVAVNFIYTRCALPQFCLRIANNFAVLQKRFSKELGRELAFLTITFDPERDTPEALGRYASRWKADARHWHFLTGAVADVHRVCAMFGVDSFPDEGLMNHSLHTAVIDRRGNLVANIEGNQYTPEQLGDLVSATLTR